jgi:hypothetical protein
MNTETLRVGPYLNFDNKSSSPTNHSYANNLFDHTVILAYYCIMQTPIVGDLDGIFIQVREQMDST